VASAHRFEFGKLSGFIVALGAELGHRALGEVPRTQTPLPELSLRNENPDGSAATSGQPDLRLAMIFSVPDGKAGI
jgi:hypothetical protein